MEEFKSEEQDGAEKDMKSWFQDNLRIIMSIVIVIAIAGGIYSYSNRNQPLASPVSSTESSLSLDAKEDTDVKQGEETLTEEMNQKEEVAQADEQKEPQTAVENKDGETTVSQSSPESTSKETAEAFVETVQRGEGMTHLARRALANYLEKDPDSALTKEHKIYIEDYLRKKSTQKKASFGASASFSKDLIKEAVEASKNLNEKQLKNLQKYANRTASLS